MTIKNKFKIYFSDFFEVDPAAIKTHGAFNISLINDLPLFVDPFLLFNSKNKEYQELHKNIIDYVKFLKDESSNKIPEGLIKNWYFFPEVKQNWLGYSKMGNQGRGLGKEFSKSLRKNLTTVFQDFGNEPTTASHIEKLTLIKNGVGKDQISDLTCNLIRGFLAEFTSQFACKYINKERLELFNVDKVEFNWTTKTWASSQYLLPKYGKQYVLLTPVNLLTKDESWINHNGFVEDFSSVVAGVANTQLRSQIDHYFVSVLPIEANKDEIKVAIEKVVEKYPLLLDLFIALKEKDKAGATKQSIEKINEASTIYVDHLKKLVTLLDSKSQFYQTGTSSYDEGMQRVIFLKHVIEKQDGYRLFYVKGIPVGRESDLQLIFKLTWFASNFDANAEVNNGRGPADFFVSYGSADKVAIEFKLAKNTHIEKNLIKQAEIYSDAGRATHPPIKAIIFFTIVEKLKINRLLEKYNLQKCKDIVLIDATEKISGSKI